jgi:hypothetical protein
MNRRITMKRFLALVAVLAVPFTAHAAGDHVPHPLLPFASPRQQLKARAQEQGLMKKGSGERLYIKTITKVKVDKPGLIEATIKGKGGMTGAQNVVLADGKFKVFDGVDGETVEGGKFDIRMFENATGVK